MPAKDLIFDAEARRQLKSGIDALANAVKVTLGPRGRNVAIDKKWGAPTVTHDGVTVAKEIELENHFQNMGAQMLKQAATKTNDVAGDGTTTATVLAQSIVTEGLRNLAAGTDEQHPDAQGRITLSADHRRYANLSKECAVIGAVDYLEIWDAQAWQDYQQTHEENFSAASDEALGDII